MTAVRTSSLAAALVLLLATGSVARAQTATPIDEAPAPSGTAVDVVNKFYQAFSTSDFDTMSSIYAPDAHWQDTIFSADNREKLMGIWRFELAPSVGGKITYDVESATP